MSSVKLTVDHTNGLAYITVSDEKIVRTIEHSSSVIVDLDAMNMAVGIELLDLDVIVPFDALKTHYHVSSETIATLKLIQPTINKFVLTSAARKSAIEEATDMVANDTMSDSALVH